MKESFKIKDLFVYRDVWMGIAILWVLMYHAPIYLKNDVYNFIKSLGYGGVDIFLFASGIGCYFSLNKNNNILAFIKKRFIRIMPMYFIFTMIWCIYKYFSSGMTLKAILGNVFCVQYIINSTYSFNWYLCALWILYILAPYFKQIIDHQNSRKSKLSLILCLLIFTIPFFEARYFIIIVTRLPIFVIGMYIAKSGLTGNILTKKHLFSSILLTILGVILQRICLVHFKDYMWNYGLYWYPFILIVPGLCIAISLFFSLLQKCKLRIFEIALSFVGKNSFEIYLTHIFIFDIYKFLTNHGIIKKSNLNVIIAILCIFPASVILKYCTKKVTKYIK